MANFETFTVTKKTAVKNGETICISMRVSSNQTIETGIFIDGNQLEQTIQSRACIIYVDRAMLKDRNLQVGSKMDLDMDKYQIVKRTKVTEKGTIVFAQAMTNNEVARFVAKYGADQITPVTVADLFDADFWQINDDDDAPVANNDLPF